MALRLRRRAVVGAVILLVFAAVARPTAVYWEEGREPEVLRVKFRGPPRWVDLGGATPEPHALDGWYTLRSEEAEAIGTELLADPAVEEAYLALAPMPPPVAVTDDFRPLQDWLDAFPGLGFDEAARWPGATGANVTIADIEYGWLPDHEDLGASPAAVAWGDDQALYAYHGNSVIGQLVGGLNGFGVEGAVPDAEVIVVSPFDEAGRYDVAAAIAAATELLVPGDVLLVEQQAFANGGYCPISVDPAVHDAIVAATAAGIVVVEPSGNGAMDLDADEWEGWFTRDHDSGSILVGGGASPESGLTPRAWYPGGSSFGSRMDLQGWFDSIVTATSGDYDGYFADLYFPSQDPLRAYTRSFGGTSGAAPMVAAIVAIAQSVSIEARGEPWSPADLRAALVATGTPQEGEELIGPQPDLRRLLRTYFLE